MRISEAYKKIDASIAVKNNLEKNMEIPKIIHYCWFGKTEIPERERECIATWEKFFPDYEIKCWNENNFNYEQCDYAKEAYENESFAFVSDYARAKLLYVYGGIYMDTDVKVLKPFPDNENGGFLGFERKEFLGTAVLASEPENKIIGQLLSYYENHHFIQKNGDIDKVANVSVLTDIMVRNGLILGGERQKAAGFEIFEREVFYPKKISEKEFRITEKTCAVHMCSNSWMTPREKKRGNNKFWTQMIRPKLRKVRKFLIKAVGREKVRTIEIWFRNKLK